MAMRTASTPPHLCLVGLGHISCRGPQLPAVPQFGAGTVLVKTRALKTPPPKKKTTSGLTGTEGNTTSPQVDFSGSPCAFLLYGAGLWCPKRSFSGDVPWTPSTQGQPCLVSSLEEAGRISEPWATAADPVLLASEPSLPFEPEPDCCVLEGGCFSHTANLDALFPPGLEASASTVKTQFAPRWDVPWFSAANGLTGPC